MERAVQARIRHWIEKDTRTLDDAAAAGGPTVDHDRVALKNKDGEGDLVDGHDALLSPLRRRTCPETGV